MAEIKKTVLQHVKLIRDVEEREKKMFDAEIPTRVSRESFH
jgi:hypothetical protein